MRWENKCELSVYSYSIDVDALVSPLYHLVLAFVRGSFAGRKFWEWAGEVFNLTAILGRDRIDEDDTEEVLLGYIARYLKDVLFGQLDKLEGTSIFLVYRDKSILIAPSKQKRLTSAIVSWIKTTELMKTFLDLVNHEGVNNSKELFLKLMNDQFLGLGVQVKEIGPLKSDIIKQSYLERYEVRPIDAESIWLNKVWREKTGYNEDIMLGEATFFDTEGYGITIGEWVLPMINVDSFVKTDAISDYFWRMLRFVYASRKKSVSIYRDRCREFVEALKNDDFAHLLDDLQYNLYVVKNLQDIPENYRSFFEEVYSIDEFEAQTKQVLFTGMQTKEQIENKQTILGLYNTEKAGTEYNLQAWIHSESTNRQIMTTAGNTTASVRIKTISALKPHLSYYFSSDFFEDMFGEVLKECHIDSLSNFELYKSDNPNECYLEIDNMVKKPDGTIVYIENKTNLNKYYIEDTINEVVRFQLYINEYYPQVRVEYLLVAPYYDETVEEGYSYFINTGGSSVADFYVPVARLNDVKLHCLVEPVFDKLKLKMEQLLK